MADVTMADLFHAGKPDFFDTSINSLGNILATLSSTAYH